MLETFFVETISMLVNLISDKVFVKPEDRAHFDFVFQDEEDNKTIIEIKSDKTDIKTLKILADKLKRYKNINNFYLITPTEPNQQKIDKFTNEFKQFDFSTYWISGKNYFKKYNFNINNNKDLERLQIAGITSEIEKYKLNQIGSGFYPIRLSNFHRNHNEINEGQELISKNKLLLARQFPFSLIGSFPNEIDSILESLKIGKKHERSIVLLSDLKNFSTIVSAIEPEMLQNLMQKYYVGAKKLVFKYNGILDKFIGDAVLAIFNYPECNKSSYLNVLKFASELIKMGKELLSEMQNNIDNIIDTGTRIGISTGKIYPLNINDSEIEITFIGSKINLAAGLEGNSETNGILVTNSFYNKFKSYWPEQHNSIKWTKKELPKEQMKGQATDIKAWQIQFIEMDTILGV
jgi:adenylate cyclase